MDVEKAMATYSRTLAWKIPWMEELGRLQSPFAVILEPKKISLSLFLSPPPSIYLL